MTRLIDADKLHPDCITKEGTLAISQSQIANAPTVEPTFGLFRAMLCETCQAYATNKADEKLEWIRQQSEEIVRCNIRTELIYSAMIPLNPTTKKNSQKIISIRKNGKTVPMITQGEKYRQYEREAGWFLRTRLQPIDYPVNVRCLFYRKGAQRVDLTNLLEAVDDILVKYKVIADDNFQIIAGHDGSRVYIDKDKPRTEIYIENISKYNKQKGDTL